MLLMLLLCCPVVRGELISLHAAKKDKNREEGVRSTRQVVQRVESRSGIVITFVHALLHDAHRGGSHCLAMEAGC